MRNTVKKHMKQNAESYEGFAVGFTNIFRRSVKHHLAAKPDPFVAAAKSFDTYAYDIRE